MEALKRQRAALKGQVTRISTFCEAPGAPLAQCKVRQMKLEQYMRDFERIQCEIEALCISDSDMNEEVIYRADFESTFYGTHAKLSEMLVGTSDADIEGDLNKTLKALVENQCSLNDMVKSVMEKPQRAITISKKEAFSRLPEVKLPEFSGRFDEWVRFRDLFQAIVAAKDALTGVEKLEYLQTHLQGEAASVVKHLPLSNENFNVAWDLLTAHYDKPQFIMIAHLDNIFEQPVIKQGSLTELKRLFSTTMENTNALSALDLPVSSWDTLLIYFLSKKLDSESRILWIRKIKSNSKPSFSDFTEFLRERINELESLQVSQVGRADTVNRFGGKRAEKRVLNATVPSCPKCNQAHLLYQCSQFRDLAVQAREKFVKTNGICPNCLRSKHKISECKFSHCKMCNLKHNTLLHFDTGLSSLPSTSNDISRGFNVNSAQLCRDRYSLLPTAIVLIKDSQNKLQQCRALLHSGSQATLISEACVQRLGLKRSHAKIPIVGLGQGENTQGTRGKVKLEIVSKISKSAALTVNAFILSSLTNELPHASFHCANISYFNHLPLADALCFRPSKVDVLLGADIFFEILSEGKVVHPSGAPIAQNTIFGWVLAGNISANSEAAVSVLHSTVDLDALLRQFFEHEDVRDASRLNHDSDSVIENHFVSTHTINSEGRYVVRLPFNKSPVEFGDSRNTALKLLNSMERRFAKDSTLKEEYVSFMREYERLGHMAPVLPCDMKRTAFYLPHHAVLKPSSATTKLRVVFNASAKSTNGFSLNDYLLVGPVIQNDLFTCVIKFRIRKIAIKADIAKMYRQILVHSEDTHFQRIVWREEVSQEPRDYVLKTVTYGTASASFLATRVLKQIGVNNKTNFPRASESLVEDFYVDDFASTFDSVEEALLVKNELCVILENAGMDLRKWSSNSPEFLNTIDIDRREPATELSISTAGVKTLGLLWDTERDCFKFSCAIRAIGPYVTKREVLSDIARIFDPLGWLSPLVVKMKIFIKRLWIKRISWDEHIPSEFYQEWSEFLSELSTIRIIKIPRWLQSRKSQLVELHGFSDASESAYAAAIYLRVVSGGDVQSNLVCAKTRIAPVKPALTIPRLELCGSLLLVKLLTKVKNAIGQSDIDCFAYTDSTTVLHWIMGEPRSRNVFVDNRVSQIKSQFPVSVWRYVRSAENPADHGTRGLMPRHLPNLTLWWHGPTFLRDAIISFTDVPGIERHRRDGENVVCLTNSANMGEWDIFERFSNLNRLYRVVARCIRLFKRRKASGGSYPSNFLTPSEIGDARTALIKLAQKQFLQEEIKYVSAGNALPRKNRYAALNPFIDEDGVLRVGGRLEGSTIPFDQKHPIILPKDHHLTMLIVRDCHNNNLHAGRRQMTYLLSLYYFIIGIHHIIKRSIFQCVTCMRQRAIPYQLQMASLPLQRLEAGVTFGNTGVDYCGPFLVRPWKGRGAKRYKVYVALFVCMATKALHLELVTDLSSAAFIAALRRFIARRGMCHTLYSDNGTNFVGANQQLREWFMLLKSDQFQNDVADALCLRGITWHFSPPHAPHFGGLWEAGVKTVKFHMRRILGEACLTYEELSTLLCQIEACANSRPLCIRFEGDVDPLTPAHFLVARPLVNVPEPELLSTRASLLNRWQYLQRLLQLFWQRWSQEYLSQLRRRPKWLNQHQNLKLNDIVVLQEEDQPPCKWLIGRITKTYPGRDGLIRVVSVSTKRGEFKRPICKLCPLPVSSS